MSWVKENFLDFLDTIGTISNETINFNEEEILIESPNLKNIEFSNCHIIAKSLRFEGLRNKSLTIRFNNCTIESELVFENCTIQGIYFNETKSLKSLILQKGFQKDYLFKIEQFQFRNGNTCPPLNTIFEFLNCSFKYEFSVYGLHHTGTFDFLRNILGEINIDHTPFTNFMFERTTINKATFSRNTFNYFTSFTTCSFTRNGSLMIGNSFVSNSFNKVSFKKTNFIDEKFVSCVFNEIAYFENNDNGGSLSFIDCSFNKYCSFNNSTFIDLSIEKSIFNNIASFQETTHTTIFIDKVIFEKGAFFDAIEIINKDVCLRRTFRNIKLQLQKTENKIDFNRFRSYELSAYYRELNWKWKGDFKDKFILWATKHVTGFDHSWRKALRFTLISSFISYSLFFISENYNYPIDFSYYREFLSGSFRFLLVTDFYNPLSDGRHYIDSTNTIGWFIFILGKIVIAFGIYEMIQAFRKFKA